MSITVITSSASEPISLDEAKLHLRVSGTAEDALIGSLITAARQRLEIETRRVFCTQTLAMTLDRFPRAMEDQPLERSQRFTLQRQPVQSVVSIQYLDLCGETQTFDSGCWKLTAGEPAKIAIRYGSYWPFTRCEADAVTVTFVAGFGGAAAVPELAKAAIRLIVGHLYTNREEVGNQMYPLPSGVQSIVGLLRWGDYL